MPEAAPRREETTTMSRYLSVRDIDWTLLVVTLAICGIGVLQIFSATRGTVWQDAWWKQILYVCTGLVLMWLIMAIDYHALLHYVPSMYVVGVVSLIGTFLIGREVFGSRRWIPLFGGFHLQVSEFVKLVIIFVSSSILNRIAIGRIRGAGPAQAGGDCGGTHASGDETAGLGDIVDVSSAADCRGFSGGDALEVLGHRRHRNYFGFTG